MARVFAWLRPNDLVWLFVANNWVMGNRPPAFDILYWNSDTTRLPAEFHADLLRMFMENPLKSPGKITALGTPIDMSKVDGAGLRRRRRHRSHHAVAGVLSVAEHPARQDRLRALLERPHPEHRESADQSESEVLPQRVVARRRRSLAGGRDANTRQLVGSLEQVVRAAWRGRSAGADRRSAARCIPRAIRRRGATSTRDEQTPRRIHRGRWRQSARRDPEGQRRPAVAAVQWHRRESRAVLSVHGGHAGKGDRDLRRARRRPLGDELAAAPVLRASRGSPTSCSTDSATSRST